MIDKAKILAIAEPLVLQIDAFIVGLDVSPNDDIELTIDAMRRLALDDCATISKQLQAQLDELYPDYSLTVFSAGIGSPLTDYRQFAKIIDQPIEITLNNGQKIKATLNQANINPDMSGNITIQYQTKELVEGKKRKEMVDKIQTIQCDQFKTICELLEIK